MPYTPKREKDLMDALARAPMGLEEAFGFFSKSASRPDIDGAETGLRNLRSFGLLNVRHTASGAPVERLREALEDPGSCEIFFDGYVECEQEIARLNRGRFHDAQEISKTETSVRASASSRIEVHGELEGAEILVERARAFTHRFALSLVQRDFATAWMLCAAELRSTGHESALQAAIEAKEKAEGTFSLFDHARVDEVYHGASGYRAAIDSRDWPKGTAKDMRRACTTFQLSSLCTPGGAMVHRYFMSLSLVEETGLLKVCKYRLYTGN